VRSSRATLSVSCPFRAIFAKILQMLKSDGSG
jgi:hypothetical protein